MKNKQLSWAREAPVCFQCKGTKKVIWRGEWIDCPSCTLLIM